MPEVVGLCEAVDDVLQLVDKPGPLKLYCQLPPLQLPLAEADKLTDPPEQTVLGLAERLTLVGPRTVSVELAEAELQSLVTVTDPVVPLLSVVMPLTLQEEEVPPQPSQSCVKPERFQL